MAEGSETGWREASHDSRRHMKHADLKRTVRKMQDAQQKQRDTFEKQMEDDYFDGALDFANGLLGNSKFGYTRSYATNYDKVFVPVDRKERK
jgi:F0F1-type ATP synthase assembly protein I